MKGYRSYPHHAQTITRLLNRERKVAGLKAFDQEQAISEFCDIYHEHTGLKGGIEQITMAYEQAWQEDKNAVFLENEQLCKRLLNGQFSIVDMSAIEPPFRHFILHPPKSWVVDIDGLSIEVPAILVSIVTPEERVTTLQNFFAKVGETNIDVGNDTQETALVIHYACPIERQKAIDKTGSPNAIRSTLRWPMSKLEQVMTAQALSDIDQLYESELAGQEIVNQEADVKLQAMLARLVAAFMVYVSAKPESLKNGLPEGVTVKDIGHSKETKPSHQSVYRFGQHEEMARAVHFRTWHLRQLFSDRYYQGEHEHKPKGSRVVFVKGAIVGEATPYTAVES